MGVIEAAERVTYADMWELPQYLDGVSPGEQCVPFLMEHATAGDTVLDAGCGAGKSSVALSSAGLHPAMCDVTDAGVQASGLHQQYPFFMASLWENLSPVAYLAKLWWPKHDAKHNPFNGTTFDWVYCCDVLEHLPPQFTMLAVDQMLRVSTKGVFLTVSTQPDNHGIWVGRPLHQTVQGFQWWRDSFRELGTVVEARDWVAVGMFLLTRRAT